MNVPQMGHKRMLFIPGERLLLVWFKVLRPSQRLSGHVEIGSSPNGKLD